jgi:rare lipoprotein A (peptidoglycan hydrolase)
MKHNRRKKLMTLTQKKKLLKSIKKTLSYLGLVLLCGGVLSAVPIRNVSSENTYDRIQAGQWVVASMYWEDKLVSTGKNFNPIGWHAAHKTLPIGTLIRVSNPKNHRSITVTINDRGPYVADRDLDLSLGAGALLGFQGLGTVYMEVLSIPPIKNSRRPIVENLFAVNDANGNCVGDTVCQLVSGGMLAQQ